MDSLTCIGYDPLIHGTYGFKSPPKEDKEDKVPCLRAQLPWLGFNLHTFNVNFNLLSLFLNSCMKSSTHSDIKVKCLACMRTIANFYQDLVGWSTSIFLIKTCETKYKWFEMEVCKT